MNVFQAIYCNQYEELVRTGRDGDKAHKNGIIIITVAIVINLFSLLTLLMIAAPADSMMAPLERMAQGLGSGRAAGKLLAAVLILVVGVVVWQTLGRPAYFRSTIESFNGLPVDEQKRVARRGAVYLLGSVGVFIVLMAVSFLVKA